MTFQRPIFQALSFTQRGKIAVAPLVSFLFRQSRPFYIAQLVMSVDIYTLKAVLRRRLASQMFQKLRVRFKTKLNTTPTVIVKCTSARAITSSFRAFISIIFRRTPCSNMSSFSVCCTRVCNGFYTTARAYFGMLQRSIRFHSPLTARASAQPHRFSLSAISVNTQKSIYKKLSKCSPCSINHFRIGFFRHLKKSQCVYIHTWYNTTWGIVSQ